MKKLLLSKGMECGGGDSCMDEFLRNLIVRKWKIGNLEFTFLDALLAVCITGTGVMLRLAVIEYTVTDTAKLIAIMMDWLLAILCGVMVYDYTESRNRAFLTYAVMVIYPTLIANSALWGKNSSYYLYFLFFGVYCYGKGEKWRGIISMAVAAVLAAVRFEPSYKTLNLGWPNFYEIIGKEMFVDLYNQVSVLCLCGILFTMAYTLVKRKTAITKDITLRLFLFLALLIPYLAPSMPAWAGLTADIAALLYCMRWPKKFYVPMLHLIVSYSAYANAINGETKLPMVLYAVILLALLMDTGAELYREITAENG